MNLFKKLVFPSSSPEKQVSRYLKSIRFYANAQLPSQYSSLLQDALLVADDTNSFLGRLVIEVNEISQDSHIIQKSDKIKGIFNTEKDDEVLYKQLLKLLTIIHVLIKHQNYQKQDIDSLSNIIVGRLRQQSSVKGADLKSPRKVMTQRLSHSNQSENNASSKIWICNLIITYTQYLMKIPSMTDIFQQCQQLYQRNGVLKIATPPAIQLTHIFRIIHQAGIILKWLHNAVNVVGRYQSVKYAEFKQFYRIISSELVSMHYYLKYLIDNIFNNYRVYDITQLKCFINVLPEIQLTSDRIEDLLVNKYFKNAKIMSKIEIKQEKVAQLMYYIDYEFKGQQKQQRKDKILIKQDQLK